MTDQQLKTVAKELGVYPYVVTSIMLNHQTELSKPDALAHLARLTGLEPSKLNEVLAALLVRGLLGSNSNMRGE